MRHFDYALQSIHMFGVEFIIAHRDPGHPNWLDTSGYNFGFMTFRWLDSKGQAVQLPVTEVVEFAELVE